MKLFAFWKYDQFPFLLGGEVTRVLPKGSVETKEFGAGYYFMPVKMLPLAEGKKINVELKALEHEYRVQKQGLHEKYMQKRDGIIKI